MSTQDLLFSDEFSAYRQKELDCAIDFVHDLFNDRVNADYIKGAVKMLEKIIKIPLEFAGTNEAKQRAADLINRDFKKFETRFIKKTIEE